MKLVPTAGLFVTLTLASCQSMTASTTGMIALLESHRGQEVRVYTAGSGDRSFGGKITSVDATSGILTLDYDIPKTEGRMSAPGMKGTHSIRIDQIQVLHISSP
jgi:small nuclear ribonucleoprotein (snRNP)-like protein